MSQRRNNPMVNQDEEKVQKKDELRRKLEDLGMFDKDMSVHDMKKCLEFIDESKNTAAKNASSNCATDTGLHTGASIPLPYSSTVDAQKTSKESLKTIGNDSTSSESLTGNINKQLQSRDNDYTDEKIRNTPKTSSSNSNLANSIGAQKNAEMLNSSKCSSSPASNGSATANAKCNENSQEKKSAYGQYRPPKSLDNINIFNIKKLPNDVPLKPRFVAKPPPRYPVINDVIMVPDEVLAKNNAHLTEMANLAYSWKAQLTCNEFSWGPPIKVGTANRSLDKFTSKEEISTDPKSPTSQSRPTTTDSGSPCYPSQSMIKAKQTFDYDECDENIFETKKEKIKPRILSTRATESLKQSQSKTPTCEASEEIVIKNQSEFKDVHDDDAEETDNLPSSRKKARSRSPEYPEQSYPRRIIPPIPSTTKFKKKPPASSSRPKQKNAASDNNENKPTKSPSSLNEKEIEASLMSNEEDIKIIDCFSPPTKRVNQSIEYLKRAQQKTEERKQKCEEEARLIAARETQEKIEKAKKRIKEKEENNLKLAEQVKSKKEREDRYRNLTKITRLQGSTKGKYQKRIELETEGLRPGTIQYSPKELPETETISSQNSADTDMFSDDEFETVSDEKVVESSECPICRKSFSLTEIENHAANCDDFVQDEPKQNDHIDSNASTSNNALQSSKYNCQVCSKFFTENLESFDEHVTNCIKSLTDEGSESTQVALSNHSSDNLVTLDLDSNSGKKQIRQPSSITNKKKCSGPSSRKRKR